MQSSSQTIGIIMKHCLKDQEQTISKHNRISVKQIFFLTFSFTSVEGYHRYLNRYTYQCSYL